MRSGQTRLSRDPCAPFRRGGVGDEPLVVKSSPACWGRRKPSRLLIYGLASAAIFVGDGAARGQGVQRMKVSGLEGTFMVYDAGNPERHPRPTAGYVAYWADAAAGKLFIYGRLVYDRVDAGHALLNLNRDLLIDAVALGTIEPRLQQAMRSAAAQPEDMTTWAPGTYNGIRLLMGLDQIEGVTQADKKLPCETSTTLSGSQDPSAPLASSSAGDLITLAIAPIGCCDESGCCQSCCDCCSTCCASCCTCSCMNCDDGNPPARWTVALRTDARMSS